MDSSKQILVIEDNRDVLKAIVSILEYLGYRSKGRSRFKETDIEKINDKETGMIILDAVLADTDGRTLVRRIKNEPAIRRIPVMMMSAYPGLEKSSLEAGADDFLQKPFGLDVLTQKVEQHLGLSASV
jgi:DNA-binding response OmpR family regulator